MGATIGRMIIMTTPQTDLNLYGDQLVRTTGTHGADISSQRMDDLDIAAVMYAAQLNDRNRAALDLGCGRGVQGFRFATLGLGTLLIDQLPQEQTVLGVANLGELVPLSYLRKDARSLAIEDIPDNLALCYSQRFIHYLRSPEAMALLRVIRRKMLPQSRLYLSASGMLSELCDGYAGKAVPVAERFAPLAPPMAEKHGIQEAVCLYTPQELEAMCRDAGFECVKVYTSPFGNVKGEFIAA